MSTSTLEPPTDTPAQEKQSAVSALKEKSLKAAGWTYLLGDAALIAVGLTNKNDEGKRDYKQASAGLLWALGGGAAARYGNPTAEKQLELTSQRLGEYLKKQGVNIPKIPTTENLRKSGGILDHIEAFLYAHPSEMLNTVYALGASQLVTSNLSKVLGKEKAKLTTEELLGAKCDLATGILVGAGALSGLLVPEKKPDPEHPPQGLLEKTKSWIQEKPLRISAGFYWGGNAVMLYAAKVARDKEKLLKSGSRNHLWRALVAGSYIFANTMLSLSSKGHAAGDKTDITPQLADVSAAVIAAQPKEVQEALVQHIAGYLSAQPEVGKTAAEIADLLHGKLAETRQSLPVAGKWQHHVQSGGEPSLSPSV